MSDTVTAEVHYEDTRADADGWQHHLYKVTLRYQGRKMTTEFRTGIGWDHEPSAADVLESLLSDAATVNVLRDGGDFEEWAADLGYDTDSRKAEAIFKQVQAQTERLERLLGDDYEAAVNPSAADEYDTERVARRLAEVAS